MISISCIYSMSIDSKTRRCDVYKNDDLIGWMAYFKDEDRIAYFNDLARSNVRDKDKAIELFRNKLIEEVLLGDI